MKIYEHKLYQEDLEAVCDLDLQWEKFQNSSIMISGATGLIGSFLVDVMMQKNLANHLNCKVYALGRHERKARERFDHYYGLTHFRFVACDVNEPLQIEDISGIDYVVHLASNTHPVASVSYTHLTLPTNSLV